MEEASVVDVPLADDQEGLRKLALRQIEAKRRFVQHAAGTAAVTLLLVVIWAVSE
jgi:hypothetical protein